MVLMLHGIINNNHIIFQYQIHVTLRGGRDFYIWSYIFLSICMSVCPFLPNLMNKQKMIEIWNFAHTLPVIMVKFDYFCLPQKSYTEACKPKKTVASSQFRHISLLGLLILFSFNSMCGDCSSQNKQKKISY